LVTRNLKKKHFVYVSQIKKATTEKDNKHPQNIGSPQGSEHELLQGQGY
jgi:hypothetical protein